MRAAIVDPGDFSPQYNLALARALQTKLDRCWLIGKFGFDETERPAFRRDHYYRLAAHPMLQDRGARAVQSVKGIEHPFDMLRLSRWLAAEQIDIVHWQWLPLPILDRLVVPRMCRNRAFIVTMHDSNPYNGDGHKWMTAGLNQILNSADAVIVHTQTARRRLSESGLPDRKLRLVPHGLLHPAKTTVKKPRLGSDKLRILQFGKIKPYKGVDVLIEALRQLGPAVRQRLQIKVVGRPYMDMQPLLAKAEAAGLADCLEFRLDYVEEAEIDQLFAHTDAALFPYREIDASGVVMTAIARGIPIIASRTGGFAEMFADGRGGQLFAVGDATALARTFETWALNPQLVGRYAAEIANKRETVPSWNAIADQTVDIYKQVLATKRQLGHELETRDLAGRHG